MTCLNITLVPLQILYQLTYNLLGTISLKVDAAQRHGQDIIWQFTLCTQHKATTEKSECCQKLSLKRNSLIG